MSGFSTVLRKTTFKLILINRVYSDTSKCPPRGNCHGLSNPVTVTGPVKFFFFDIFSKILGMEGACTEKDLLKREIETHPVVSSVSLHVASGDRLGDYHSNLRCCAVLVYGDVLYDWRLQTEAGGVHSHVEGSSNTAGLFA